MKPEFNILSYPQSTIVDKVVPKTMFYRFMEVNPRMKVRFVNDVAQICWLYKLSASTLNVTDSEEMKEIEIFVATLKQQDCPTDLFTFIDTNMPHHLVFILKYEEQYMLLVNYKEWKDATHTQFRITKAFASPWVERERLKLEIEGLTLQRIYDNFVAQVSGIGEHKAGALAEIVELKKRIAAAEAELQALEKKMRKEPQYDVQVRMNQQVKKKRQEVAAIKQKLEKLQ
ncbi:MAG: DUF4391 domain-containing protein [Bacteroidales bacterium]|nr:DUF4391 domain-containing protein [Bacteroidales bacterium]